MERKHFIDLTRYRFRRVVGDVVVYATWAGESDDSIEPALVLVPLVGRSYWPCCVLLSAAFRFDNPRYMARRARDFATALGLVPSMTVMNRIAHAIIDNLGELVAMPPEPTDAVVVADGALSVDGARPRSVEIVDHQPKPFD